MTTFHWIIAVFVTLNVALQLFAVYRLWLFRRSRERLEELHRQSLDSYPGISIVVSLKGETDGLAPGLECLRKQTYRGALELVLVVQDPNDPALIAGKKITESWPKTELLAVKWVTGFKPVGLNPRCAKMSEGLKHASHEWLYWHAIDTVIEPDHMKTAMLLGHLDKSTFVTSFPVNVESKSLGARLETICLNLEVTKFFILTFAQPGAATAYGGSMLFHRELLERSGGLASTLDRLTDDVVLTKQFMKAGAKCLLSPHLVTVPQHSISMKDYFKRQVRWMMIARYYMPEIYFPSPLFLVGQALAIAGFVGQDGVLLWMAAGFFVFRMIQALVFEILLGGPIGDWINSLLLPIYDVLLPVIWFLALVVGKLNWAGDIMIVGPGGILKPLKKDDGSSL